MEIASDETRRLWKESIEGPRLSKWGKTFIMNSQTYEDRMIAESLEKMGTHPSLFEFPQVQENGDVWQNWFDVILERPSGLTIKDFGWTEEELADLWSKVWEQDSPDSTAAPSSSSSSNQNNLSPAHLRIIQDLNQLNVRLKSYNEFLEPDELMNFTYVMRAREGFYEGVKFVFNFKVGPNYPDEPPEVTCQTEALVYHPNIDREGNVCLNILKDGWASTNTISNIISSIKDAILKIDPEVTNRPLYEIRSFRSM